MQDRPKGFFCGDVVKVLNLLSTQRNPADLTAFVPPFHDDPLFKIGLLLSSHLLPGNPGTTFGIGEKSF